MENTSQAVSAVDERTTMSARPSSASAPTSWWPSDVSRRPIKDPARAVRGSRPSLGPAAAAAPLPSPRRAACTPRCHRDRARSPWAATPHPGCRRSRSRTPRASPSMAVHPGAPASTGTSASGVPWSSASGGRVEGRPVPDRGVGLRPSVGAGVRCWARPGARAPTEQRAGGERDRGRAEALPVRRAHRAGADSRAGRPRAGSRAAPTHHPSSPERSRRETGARAGPTSTPRPCAKPSTSSAPPLDRERQDDVPPRAVARRRERVGAVGLGHEAEAIGAPEHRELDEHLVGAGVHLGQVHGDPRGAPPCSTRSSHSSSWRHRCSACAISGPWGPSPTRTSCMRPVSTATAVARIAPSRAPPEGRRPPRCDPRTATASSA